MEVFKLLMEIVKETSSIIRKDDQLSSQLQTAIKEGVEEGLGNKQKDSDKEYVSTIVSQDLDDKSAKKV